MPLNDYSKCRSFECLIKVYYAECCRYAECCYTECRYAECRGAAKTTKCCKTFLLRL
jgi:hypothetical protein